MTPEQVRFRVRQIEGRAKALVAEVEGEDFTALAQEADDLTGLVDLVAEIQNARRELASLEASATRIAGLLVRGGAERDGYLPDGRQWSLHRTADRKAWDHEGWKHAVRGIIVGKYLPEKVADSERRPALINAETGEEFDYTLALFALAVEIQEVHGSTAPRTGVLKSLGVVPGDYCEQVSGNWKLDTIAPTTKTIQEN